MSGCEGDGAVPIACTLQPEQMDDRLAEWRALLDQVVSRDALAGGIRLRFPGAEGLAATIADLAEREHACCAFFEFAVGIGGDGIVLDVRAPDEAADLVATLFAAPAQPTCRASTAERSSRTAR